MVGILIVAHGTLGESLIHCASHVLGSRPLQLMQVGVTIHDDPQQILPQAIKLVRQLDQGDGVLVLTDVYGATPSNIASQAADPRPGGRRSGREPADAGAGAHLSQGAAQGGGRQGAIGRRRGGDAHASGESEQCSNGKLRSSTSWACTRGRRPSSPSSPASYQCEVWLSRNGRRVNAKSIMGVMMLAAAKGSRLMIETSGPDEEEAMNGIVQLIAEKFGESGVKAGRGSEAKA